MVSSGSFRCLGWLHGPAKAGDLVEIPGRLSPTTPYRPSTLEICAQPDTATSVLPESEIIASTDGATAIRLRSASKRLSFRAQGTPARIHARKQAQLSHLTEDPPKTPHRPKAGLALAGFLSAVASYALTLIAILIHYNPYQFSGPWVGPLLRSAFYYLPAFLFWGGMLVCLVYVIRRMRKRTTEGGLGFAIAGLAITLLPVLAGVLLLLHRLFAL